jgi:hypothetical protein
MTPIAPHIDVKDMYENVMWAYFEERDLKVIEINYYIR